jgi:hypothetical protein
MARGGQRVSSHACGNDDGNHSTAAEEEEEEEVEVVVVVSWRDWRLSFVHKVQKKSQRDEQTRTQLAA